MPTSFRPSIFRSAAAAASLAALVLAQSCRDSTGLGGTGSFLSWDPPALSLDVGRDTVIAVHNNGIAAIGPIELSAGAIRNGAGDAVAGPWVALSPRLLPTLNAGASREVTVSIVVPNEIAEDTYSATLAASIPAVDISASAELTFSVDDPLAGLVTDVQFTATPASALRQGDALHLVAEARDGSGQVVGATIQYSVVPSSAGYVDGSGTFVGYEPGTALVTARAGTHADTAEVEITPRGLSGSFSVVGRGTVLELFTSDLWVHGEAAYTGTWGSRLARFGNTLNTWDLSDPTTPVKASSLTVDARTVNDVKVRSDGLLGLITHEGSNDGLNGVTLLDLSDPLQPSVISRVTESLETGIHNAWIDDNYAYLVVDGVSPSSGLRVLDIGDPGAPEVVARYYGGSSFLHDVYVRDGLAFLSHWNAGLIVLDVGNGLAGGSPTNPMEVSRVLTQGGQTHNAWYWPGGGYVFVGEEDFGTPGIMHVVDVHDIWNPREVATFEVPGTTPHNFWMDEGREVLYLAWYANGIRALDVSGELLGALDRQGREITGFQYAEAGGGEFPTRNWAPQFHNGLLYLSDMNTGLWVLGISDF